MTRAGRWDEHWACSGVAGMAVRMAAYSVDALAYSTDLWMVASKVVMLDA